MSNIILFLIAVFSLGSSIILYYDFYYKIVNIKNIGLFNDICKIYTGGGLSSDKIHWEYNFYYTSSYDIGIYFKHYNCIGDCLIESFENINCYLNPCHEYFKDLYFYKSDCNYIQKSYDIIFTQKDIDKQNIYLIISFILIFISIITFLINFKMSKKIKNNEPPEYQP